jgi:hypothetical protein
MTPSVRCDNALDMGRPVNARQRLRESVTEHFTPAANRKGNCFASDN